MTRPSPVWSPRTLPQEVRTTIRRRKPLWSIVTFIFSAENLRAVASCCCSSSDARNRVTCNNRSIVGKSLASFDQGAKRRYYHLLGGELAGGGELLLLLFGC